jgi:purine-binding chemotaxis protein CheW
MLETTAVPQASRAMIGLFGRSGRVFSAFDLGVALGLAPADMRAGHLVLMRHAQARIAMRVDRAVALMNLIVDPDPSAPTPVSRELVLGYARPTGKDSSTQLGHIALLDSDRLMSQFVSSFRPSGV